MYCIINNETTLFQHGKLCGDVRWSFIINHIHINDEVPPWYALLGGVAGTIGAKIVLFFETAKYFMEKLLFAVLFPVKEAKSGQ